MRYRIVFSFCYPLHHFSVAPGFSSRVFDFEVVASCLSSKSLDGTLVLSSVKKEINWLLSFGDSRFITFILSTSKWTLWNRLINFWKIWTRTNLFNLEVTCYMNTFWPNLITSIFYVCPNRISICPNFMIITQNIFLKRFYT